MAGYTRQSGADIVNGEEVTAPPLAAEFNQLQAAFHGSTGHEHDGTTGDGPRINLTTSVTGVLPIANGGSGGSSIIDAYDNIHNISVDIAVGATVDLSTSDGDFIEITGTGGTITSFGTCDIGVKRTLYFSGASNTITHNGTSLICPNGVNITVKAGEQLVVRSLGSGNWIVELLMKNSSAALGNLVLAADKLPYMSSTTAMSLADLTTFGRSLVDDSDAATARTTLGLGTISTQDSNNVTISGGAITGITDLAVADGGTGASTAANARTNLGLVIDTDVQAYDSGLAALAAFNTNGILTQTAADTFVGRTITGTSNEITVTNGNGVSGDPTLSLPSSLTFTGKTITGGAFTGGTWNNGTIGATTASSGVFNALTLAATQPTLVIKDTANTGNNTFTGVGFYDSAGTRKGFIGDANTGNQQIYLVADAGPIEISPGFVSGNQNVILTKGQLTFPATQNASSDANTLDDYEEGTWTPTYVMSTTNFTSVSYTAQEGFYVKIGSTVIATWTLLTSAVTKGAAAGNLTVAGLPFTTSSTDYGGYISFAGSWLGSAPGGALTSGTSILLYKRTTSDGTMTNMAVTDVGTGASANQSRGTVIYSV